MRPIALTIAGLDPSGGAGLAADLRAFERLGAHGAAVATLWTVQGSRGVESVHMLAPADVAAQLDGVLEDMPVRAAKTGALGRAEIVEVVGARFAAAGHPLLVVDPVLFPTAGAALGDDGCADAILRWLVPVATLVTPNLPELARLSGRPTDTEAEVLDACRALVDRGARAVLAKGGHASGDRAVDVLFVDGRVVRFDAARVATPGPIHGAGCTLSAAVTARLAAGDPLDEAIGWAKEHVSDAIAGCWAFGRGPLRALR